MQAMKIREGVAVIGAGLAIGVGWGIAVESHTNEVAKGKIITAEYCLGKLGTEATLDKSFLDCVHDGVPGGRKIGSNKFQEGEPREFVDAYIQAQRNEADSIEPGRIVGWSAAPFVVAAAAGWFGFFDD